jgi:hypothetical protein
MGYIKTYTDTNTNTQLSQAQVGAYAVEEGFIKTYTDTNTQLTSAEIAAMGYTSNTGTLTSSNDRNYITDTRGAARAPSYYNDRYAQWDFQNVADTGVGGDGWHALLTVSKWADWHASHRQEQLIFSGDHLWRRTATSDTVWGTNKKIWDSGNLTNNNQLSNGAGYKTTDNNTQLTSAQIAEMGYTSNTGTVTTVGVTAGVGISVSIANRTTEPQITLTNTGYYFQGANTGYVGSGGMQNWNSQESTPNLNPNTNWFTSLRIGHGHPVDYYSNTLGIQMTGSDSGRIYTRNIAGGTAGSWKKYYHTGDFSTADVAKGVTAHGWSNHADAGYLTSYTDTNTQLTPAQVLTSIKAVDGSGSGLDADTVDGSHANLSYGAGKQYDFTINGDADTFYPVVIHGASNARMTRLTIFRGYSETAPSTWNTASHKGGLTLDMDVRFGGWGGYPNMMNVHDFGEIYSRICGGASWTAHTIKFVIWLRGCGAADHMDSPD